MKPHRGQKKGSRTQIYPSRQSQLFSIHANVPQGLAENALAAAGPPAMSSSQPRPLQPALPRPRSRQGARPTLAAGLSRAESVRCLPTTPNRPRHWRPGPGGGLNRPVAAWHVAALGRQVGEARRCRGVGSGNVRWRGRGQQRTAQ